MTQPVKAQATPLMVWVWAARPKTLPAACAPVVVGSAMAYEAGGFHLAAALCALAAALLIQIGTNFCNDYGDFVRGADTAGRKGPLRVTQAGLVSAKAIRRATALTFALAVAAGLFLIARGGVVVALIGALSIAAGVLYTAGRYPLAYLGLGDAFVLLFFGPVAVGGTYYVQVLEISGVVLIAGLATGLMSTAILVVNNVRDIEEDRRAGKKTLVVRFGRRFGVALWACCVVAAALIPLELLVVTGAHRWAALTLLVLIPGLAVLRRLYAARQAERLNPLLGWTALLLLVHSVLFSLGWILS